MTNAREKGVIARFLDANEEPNQSLLPIKGYAKEPLLSLEDALEPVSKMLDDLDAMVDIAKRNCKKPADGLSSNESAAIHLYTMQWDDQHESLFTVLNRTLRSERREHLRPWFRYLKLILTALYKLPSLKTTVWRGVRGNLADQYDEDHIWWGFSSCTETVEIVEQFVGKSGVRTLFNIECMHGKAVRAHSFYKKESEIILMPGTYFRVISKWSPSKDLYIVHLRETHPPHIYLEPPFSSSSTTASASGPLAVTTDTLVKQAKATGKNDSTLVLNEQEQIQIAKLAEKTERYEDMVQAMKSVAMSKKMEFTSEERNMFSVGYKNVIGGRRSAWRSASEIVKQSKTDAVAKQQLQKIEKEIKDICHEVLDLLEKFLIPNTKTAETKVFFWKMKGDYYRYLAEILTGDEQKRTAKEAQKWYDETFSFAKTNLIATHPIRLGLALNMSVFYYEILNDLARACYLAKQAFDDAIAELDTVTEDTYKDCTLIMQLIRDNLVLWTSDSPDDDKVEN